MCWLKRATPDERYYVGLDMASDLHPQTLLCDTMNHQRLTREHGAPLRLYLAVKYGYKSLKRVGLIRFQDERPSDYWAARGYDWDAGLCAQMASDAIARWPTSVGHQGAVVTPGAAAASASAPPRWPHAHTISHACRSVPGRDSV